MNVVKAQVVVGALSRSGQVRRLISAGLSVCAKAEEIGKALFLGHVFKTFDTFELATVRPLSSFPELKLPILPQFARLPQPGVAVAVYKFTLDPEYVRDMGDRMLQGFRLLPFRDALLRYHLANRVMYLRRDMPNNLGITSLHGEHCYFGVQVAGSDLSANGGELRVGFVK